MTPTLVVLGAGPAGLAAAWWAARDGHRVVVLERAAQVGGLAASFEVGGVRVDHGSHRLHPTVDPAVLAELRGAGVDLQTRPRHGRIRLEDRWIAFPLRAGDLVRRLPPGFAARAALDAATAPLRRPRSDTFAEVVRAGLGPTMADRFYDPYARKLFGEDPRDLDGELARRRVGASSPGRILARLRRRKGRSAGTFLYPTRGFGEIADRLADAAADAGADVRTGWQVTAVHADDDGVTVTARPPDGPTEELRATGLWSTIPLPALARLADPPPDVAAATDRLGSRGMALVYLVLDRGRWTEFDAHYLPGPETPVSRVSEPRNYRDGPDPAGRTVLCAEVPCQPGDEVWCTSDTDLGTRVAGDLRRLGLPDPDPVDVVVRRVPAAYPVYRRGWDDAFAIVDRWVGGRPGVLTFGRQGLFAHDNTHHALAMARAAVDALRDDGTVDPARWAAARAGFTTHVVED